MSSYLSQENNSLNSSKGKLAAIGLASLAVCGIAYHQQSSTTGSSLFQSQATQEYSNINEHLVGGNWIGGLVSFENYLYPNSWIRVKFDEIYNYDYSLIDFQVWSDEFEDTLEFAEDATWRVVDGVCGRRGTVSFESYINLRNYMFHEGWRYWVWTPNAALWESRACFTIEWSSIDGAVEIISDKSSTQGDFSLYRFTSQDYANNYPLLQARSIRSYDERAAWIAYPSLHGRYTKPRPEPTPTPVPEPEKPTTSGGEESYVDDWYMDLTNVELTYIKQDMKKTVVTNEADYRRTFTAPIEHNRVADCSLSGVAADASVNARIPYMTTKLTQTSGEYTVNL